MSDLSRSEEILRERARRLAERGAGEAARRELVRVMAVHVGDSRYALPLHQILEVRPLRELTPVPGAPAECLGLVNVRNELRAVVDLGLLLGGASTSAGGFLVFPRPALCGERQVGLRVEALGDVYDVDRALLSPPPGKSGEGQAVRRGVDEGGVSLLDLSFVFGTDKGETR